MRHLGRDIDRIVERLVEKAESYIGDIAYQKVRDLLPERELTEAELEKLDSLTKEVMEKVIDRLYHRDE